MKRSKKDRDKQTEQVLVRMRIIWMVAMCPTFNVANNVYTTAFSYRRMQLFKPRAYNIAKSRASIARTEV